MVEPPIDALAVIEPRSNDRRPTILAIVLAVAYLVVLAIPAGRSVFALQPLGLAELAVVAVAVAAWAVLLVLAWRHRVVERFLGI